MESIPQHHGNASAVLLPVWKILLLVSQLLICLEVMHPDCKPSDNAYFIQYAVSLQDFFFLKKSAVFTFTECSYIYIVVIGVIVLLWSCKALKCCKL